MYGNCDSNSFKYRENTEEKTLALDKDILIKDLLRGNED